MRTFAIVTILIAVLVGFTAGGRHAPPVAEVAPDNGGRPSLATQPPAPPFATPGTVQIERGAGGHFTVAGFANGTILDFIVDTGASKVALNRADAARLGMIVSDADFTGEARTASGTIRVAARTLPQLRVGSIQVEDVPVLILDVPGAMPLLGQSFLARMSKVAIEGDRMTLIG